MSLRKRLSLIAAASVGVAVLLAIVICYMVVRSQLNHQINNELTQQEQAVSNEGIRGLGATIPGIPARNGGPAQYWEIFLADGQHGGSTGTLTFQETRSILQIARNGAGSYMGDIYVGSNHLRVLVFGITYNGVPGALLLARPLNGVDSILAELRLILALVLIAGMALAAALGRFAARRVLRPLGEVAEAAQHIGETEDLSGRIRVHADDEVGQLATRFNAMIERLQGSRAALDESVQAQRQLVADASHELRTPITSLRTNIEVLMAGDALSEADRHRLLADVLEQSEELSALIGDVIELARGDLPITTAEDIRLDRLVADSLSRAHRDFPDVRFESSLEPTVVDGVPERLARAVNNLLDNAAHHSAAGGVVEVIVDQRGVQVRDHGTGIDPADLPYVFDRFFRGANSRGRQGSGLGLAIVRQAAVQHGGSVEAANAPDGGAVFTLRLPTLAEDHLDHADDGYPVQGDPLSLR